ncbi:MAG: hypothetical protein IPP58_07380 [Holophagaceae bacterium]|uniref:Uncharacterized protein n=1 Tax=Candidatus Geothrix skivensis TaxID=2954439 RepID=A0A9D7SGM6_9BACT|nr:hypothetical protein [Candidatus Geothrix skivensis]
MALAVSAEAVPRTTAQWVSGQSEPPSCCREWPSSQRLSTAARALRASKGASAPSSPSVAAAIQALLEAVQERRHPALRR